MPKNQPTTSPVRRALLQQLGFSLSSFLLAGGAAHAGAAKGRLHDRRLIIITLDGGNDGLNTVVPFRDPLYSRFRPSLALPQKQLLPLNSDLGFHPSLKALRSNYERGELAVLQGVGCPANDLSHFISADYWNAGHLGKKGSDGWFTQVVADNLGEFSSANFDVGAVALDADPRYAYGSLVPVMSETLLSVGGTSQETQAMAPPSMRNGADAMMAGGGTDPSSSTAAFESLSRQIRLSGEWSQKMKQRLHARLADSAPPLRAGDASKLEINTKNLAWMLHQGVTFPVARLALLGFDTHSLQLQRQSDLLHQLDDALTFLRDRLIQEGIWDQSLILVQSEFGRRVAERDNGTDHGSAGVAFMLGGAVKGGIYGRNPQLDNLDKDGNLRPDIDFRSLYSTLVSNWWQLGVNRFANRGFMPLDAIKG
jgi:uncharacterized protein (DUF1501 family)